MELKQNQRDWEDLAEIDPMWAILSHPGKREGRWDRDAFADSGRVEIEALMRRAAAVGLPRRRTAALDFGCGLGRLSRPLARHFDRCVGVDISQRMVDEARGLSSDVPNLEFIVDSTAKIPAVVDASVDLIYSRIVLQHVSSRAAIRSYLAEFARMLSPGGLLVFQLPSYIPVRHRLQPRPRAYGVLRGIGVPAPLLYRRLGLQPIRMRWIAADAVHQLLVSRGLRVLDVETEHINAIRSTTYYATRDETSATRRASPPRQSA